MRRTKGLAVVTLLLGCHGLALGADKGAGSFVPFPLASVHLEQNVTDADAEVVFEVKGGKEGLAKLTVVGPDGRTVIDFTAPGASALFGIQQLRFEPLEHHDAKGLMSTYPEGTHTFGGATAAGGKLHGKAALSHKLPATASSLRPAAKARGVNANGLKITWSPVKDATAYIIKLEQPMLGVNLTSTLPGSVATFGVPEGLLRAGTEYQLAIGTVSDEGNMSFVETTFTIAGNE
jgi:hypothetical protein